jgi:hypothetical protein
MSLFRREKKDVQLISPEVEAEYIAAMEKKKEADKHFHNIKSTCGPKVLEIFLDALAKGKIQKEPHHG